MDQDKTNIPNMGALDQTVRVVGAIVHGVTKDVRLYLVDRFTKETNTMVEVLRRVLESRKHLPPVLILQLDNTSQENKNNRLFGFLAVLVEAGVFEEIIVNFLPVGHTHEGVSIFLACPDVFLYNACVLC
jgi:hypothetical protein